MSRTATTDINTAITQVAKHIHRGLYKIHSMNVSERSCTVVLSTEMLRADLQWKNGFPWDREDDPQPDIIL